MGGQPLLPPETVPGTVHLAVRDPEREISFYRDALGLRVKGRPAGSGLDGTAGMEGTDGADETEGAAGVVRLGNGRRDLLLLEERPDAVPEPGAAGLYHFAVLYPSRRELAEAVLRLTAAGGRIDGAADHLVSEAVYLTDPEGNGIELYCDRPRDAWFGDDGTLRMATLPLDLDGLLAEAPPEIRDFPDAARIGHVHLQVQDVAASRRFYTEGLGMSLMLRFGSQAAFVSAGGYHHHIGFNSWDRPRRSSEPDRHAGLVSFGLVLPDEASLGTTAERLRLYRNGHPEIVIEQDSGEFHRLTVRDPSGIRIVLETSGLESTGRSGTDAG